MAGSLGTAEGATAAAGYELPFPLEAYDASDPYGEYGAGNWRDAAGLGKHRGVDFNRAGAVYNAPVRAVADGVIDNKDTGLGNRVVVRHDDGKYSGYAHMIAPSMHAVGTRVVRGQTIGYVGNTGNVGTHLHLSMGTSRAGALGSGTYHVDHFDPIAFILGPGQGDQDLTPEQDFMLTNLYSAMFSGGPSMPSGMSLAAILQPGKISRGSGELPANVGTVGEYSMFQEVADAKTLLLKQQLAVAALTTKIDAISARLG